MHQLVDLVDIVGKDCLFYTEMPSRCQLATNTLDDRYF